VLEINFSEFSRAVQSWKWRSDKKINNAKSSKNIIESRTEHEIRGSSIKIIWNFRRIHTKQNHNRFKQETKSE
jgi:hypothetical protein